MSNAAYLNWMSKLSRPKGKSLDSNEYLRAKEILETEFLPFMKGGISTLEEVLADVDWSKSPGWPYVNQGCSTKLEAWEKFSDVITQRAHALTRGEYVECNFIASLKDELLPQGKNTRVFLPAPFHHQLACAMLFKKSTDSITATVHKHSSAIGINIFGRGLEQAFRKLEKHPYGYDADQSGCDTSCKDTEPERDFLKNGLPPWAWPGVDMLFNTAMCPRVIVGDRVLQLEMNPSGWYLTTLINTLITHRTIAAAYLDLSPTPQTIKQMREHLCQLNGGDDLAYSTDQEWFTIVKLANEVAKRGMYLESDHLEPRNPMKLTFFSHNLYPRYIDKTQMTCYVACGRLSKILSSFSYLKKSDGTIDWYRNASRLVGLMINLWPYKTEYDNAYPYLYHLVHHYFLMAGSNPSPEWSGLFRSIPTDDFMLTLRSGATREAVPFFPAPGDSSFNCAKRVYQSALKVPSSKMNNDNHSTRKIDGVLENLEKVHGLSPAGKDWLICATDPFHDFDLPLAGYPDVSTDATVVQLVKNQFVVQKPSGIPAGNWDCQVALFPCLGGAGSNYIIGVDGLGRLMATTGSAGIQQQLGGCRALAVKSGQPFDLNATTASGNAVVNAGGVDPWQYVSKGNCRLIGAAIEIVNTTAEINKQGSVTVYRKPAIKRQRQTVSTTGTSPVTPCAINSTDTPALSYNLAEANTYFGSRTWSAAEGCYVIGRLNGTDNPMSCANNIPVTVPAPYYPGNPPQIVQSFWAYDLWSSYLGGSPTFMSTLDLTAAYFSGLSENSTLTVTVRWVIERQPNAEEDPNLAVLATPSPGYDPLALEIYTRAMQHQPPGVKLSENPLGEWFKKVLKGVGDWAPKIGDALGTVIPGASMLGKVIGGGARLLTPKDKIVPLLDSKSHTEAPETKKKPQRKIKYVPPYPKVRMPSRATKKK